MTISIYQDVLNNYPDYLMGVVELSIVNYDSNKLQTIIAAEIAEMKVPMRNSSVESKWKEIFINMKASEKRLPSITALWNLQERFGELRSINYFVDAYNHISTKHGIPMGGYDINNLPADDITLRYAKRGDKFQPLGLNQVEKIKDENEIAYYSGSNVICRYWNHKDSELTKITENSKRLVIIFDFFGEPVLLNKAMDELETLLISTSNVSFIRKNHLSVKNPTIILEVGVPIIF